MRWFSSASGDHLPVLAGEGLAGTRAHLAIAGDDLDASLDRCREHRCTPDEEPMLWGSPWWFLRDPAGNLLEPFDSSPPSPADG